MRFVNNLNRTIKSIRNDTKKEITRIALICERNAKTSMTGGGRPHAPSRPGQPPHVDTGRLRASITHEIEETLFGVIARVGTNVEYGRYLELGTSRMLPRPWLVPALKKTVRGLRA